MLIALSGGSAADRQRVAESLKEAGVSGLVLHAQETPELGEKPNPSYAKSVSGRRSNILRELLAGRSRRLNLVLVHCLCEQEADVVRLSGGSIWHLYEKPSPHVVMRLGDPVVSLYSGVPGHVLEPLEAYSEMALRRLASSQETRSLIKKIASE